MQTVEHKAFIVLERDTQIGSDERRKLSGEHDIRRFAERLRKAFDHAVHERCRTVNRADAHGIDRVPGENALVLGVDGNRRKLRRLLAEREQTQLHARRDGRADQRTGFIQRGERGRGAERNRHARQLSLGTGGHRSGYAVRADLPRLLGADVESGLDTARYLDDIADAEQAQRTLEHADHARNDRADNAAVDAAHVHAVQQKHLLQLAGVVVARQLRLGCDGGRKNLSVLLIAAEQNAAVSCIDCDQHGVSPFLHSLSLL